MAKKMVCPACTCGPREFLWMIVSAIVMAVGAYVAVMAVRGQWTNSLTFVAAAAWYTLAVIILMFGKMAKWKSMACCPAHGK